MLSSGCVLYPHLPFQLTEPNKGQETRGHHVPLQLPTLLCIAGGGGTQRSWLHPGLLPQLVAVSYVWSLPLR